MSEVILFAGTTEGRELAEYLSRQKVKTIVCTATEYGGMLVGNDAYRTVRPGRMDREQMCALLRERREAAGASAGGGHSAVSVGGGHSAVSAGGGYSAVSADGGRSDAAADPAGSGRPDAEVLVVDATHPYAVEVSANIKEACHETGAKYIRLLRASESAQGGRVETVASVEEAVAFLQKTTGNILVTTGSKELAKFTDLSEYENRVYARVLSSPEVAAECARLGFVGRHLICMQGPFCEELNAAMLRQIDAKWMVTKESGKAGGFLEKIAAAEKTGTRVVLIGRPAREEGESALAVRARLIRALKISVRRHISIVGIGMGPGGMTEEALAACGSAELLIGAERMLDALEVSGHKFASYRPQEIRAYLDEHPEYERVALLQSGDVGFFSGAKRLYPLFAGDEVAVYPGISSVAALGARLHTSWEDAKLLSLHGRTANLIAAVRENKKVFALTGGGAGVREILEKLVFYGMDELRVTVAENISYPDERIRTGTARELLEETFADLAAVWIENPLARPAAVHGIEDGEFLRAEVPMTKSEVRSVSLSKLRLRRDSIVYDVGAGTGSVAVEAALQSPDGWVYAIEKKPEAVRLIRENQRKFAADNLTAVEGTAPEALADLPDPTHVFIGGSSGNLRAICEAVLHKNPRARIVINCIALETAAEALACVRELSAEEVDIVTVSVGKSREIGNYHMMMGQNPVTILSFRGGAAV